MVQLHELIHYLNEELEVSTIDDFCPNGLQVEGLNKPIDRIATAVSASLETIQKAVQLKAQVLLVHHGLFWNKDPYPIQGIKKEKLVQLLNHGITLLTYHLPLDCHKKYGNNWKAAIDMGWKDLKGFGPFMNGLYLGVYGKVEKQSRLQFQQKLESFYQHPAHVALGGREEIERVALISGGAHREIHKAVAIHADAFITGSFDEPTWNIAHEEKINFFAMGHSHTEKIGPKALGEHLKEKYHLKHEFIDVENPF